MQQEFVDMRRSEAVQAVDTSQLPIGKALRVERVLADVSVTHVAHAVGISVGQLTRIEKGQRTASPELVERIRVAIRASGGKAA